MKNILIALCWLISLGVLSLHAESFHSAGAHENVTAHHRPHPDPTAASCSADIDRNGFDNTAPQRFASINFSKPLHLPGQKPATGNGSIMPSGLSGNPQVVSATPVLQHQPLILNSDLANGPCCYEEGIQVLVREPSDHYFISFDLASQNLEDSFNQFQLWINDAEAPLLRFQADHMLVVEDVGAVASFRDNHLLHVQLHLDLPQQQLHLSINGETLYQGEMHLANLQALQFLMTIEGGATPEQVNPEARVAIDNIVVANGRYRYANLQTSLQHGAHNSQWRDGRIEFVSHVKNISDHPAEDLVLTHLLPPGVTVAAISSEQLACETSMDQVICRGHQLGAMEQAFVTIQLASLTDQAPVELTVIATSSTDEIDNYDNQVKARVGGSTSLLIVVGLLAFWLARRWTEED